MIDISVYFNCILMRNNIEYYVRIKISHLNETKIFFALESNSGENYFPLYTTYCIDCYK